MVFPSCADTLSDNAGEDSVQSKVIRTTLPMKGKKLARKRRKAKRRREKYIQYIKETNEMASMGNDPYGSYWSNYFRGMKWVQNHHASDSSYWKSRAEGLEYENMMLRSLVEKYATSLNLSEESGHNHDCRNNSFSVNDYSNRWQETGHETEVDRQNSSFHFGVDENTRNQTNQSGHMGNEDASEREEFTFEIDDNMIEFFTQSMKHKLELKREREQNDSENSNESHNTCSSSRSQRRMVQIPYHGMETEDADESSDDSKPKLKLALPTRLKQDETVKVKDLEDILLQKTQREEKQKLAQQLYGKSASKILGMETAVQLNFRQFCNNKDPVLWPVIPLNL